jgi:hypothetical protein
VTITQTQPLSEGPGEPRANRAIESAVLSDNGNRAEGNRYQSASQEHHQSDSAVAEQLWELLYLARAGKSRHRMADLEDAVFRFYLPMARTLAHTVGAESVDRFSAEQAAELGLAHAVLAWQQRTSGGFRRFARSSIVRQLTTIDR